MLTSAIKALTRMIRAVYRDRALVVCGLIMCLVGSAPSWEYGTYPAFERFAFSGQSVLLASFIQQSSDC